MKTFHTFTNNDIYIAPSGRLAIVTELEAIMKVCENVVQTIMGELILQGNEGIPNFQLIWNGAPNIAQAEASIREALMNVDGVMDVVELTSFVEANIFKYNAIIKTKYGTGAINGI